MSESRETIDVGIDLGTTNSAVAIVEDGIATVVKNNDGWDTTPSAVWIPKPGSVHVGRRARERTEIDPDNAAAEFKLEMGLADVGRWFTAARTMLTPVQLSAEVLKSLRADAAHREGEPPDAAVVTVPAAFALHQTKATQEAAALAGLGPHCPLLQEPTAAAFAYGADSAAERAYWMVFDFGGGTFDAAVVTKRDGELSVLDHAGDPFLGGKLIDWALVERVLAPAAARDLGLDTGADGFRREGRRWRADFAKLKLAAEEAKIALSRRDTVEVLVELSDPAGGTRPFEYTVTRGELDAVAEPFYRRAIGRCRDALAEGGLAPDDIDLLLLVGGTTLAPGLRERLADPREGLGIPDEHGQDPTTVVARGAAVFAATLRAPDRAARPGSGSGSLSTAAVTAELVHEPTTTSDTPTVGGRLRDGGTTTDWSGWSVVLDNPAGRPPFRTPRVDVGAQGGFLTEVRVDEGATSRFTLELTDPSGARVALTPDTLAITHTRVEFGGAVLTQSLGIAKADGSSVPLVHKGAALPVHARETFRTTVTLRRGDAQAVIGIPVLEGERARADRNREVGRIEIRPRDLRYDLPSGSDVEVTVEVDESRLVTVTADVPLVAEQFEAEINLSEVRVPPADALREQFREVERRLALLRTSATAEGATDASRRLDALEEEGVLDGARDQVRAAVVDVGAAATGEARLREVQAVLDDVENVVRLPALLRELDAKVADVGALVEQRGAEDQRTELAEIRRQAEGARRESRSAPAAGAALVGGLLDRLRRLEVRLLQAGPEWELTVFHSLRDRRAVLFPPEKADQADRLLREGEQAVAAGDRLALSTVNERLRRLVPSAGPSTRGGVE